MSETFEGRGIVGRGDAESVAIQVLAFIVADDGRLGRFLNVTGLQPETIRETAKSPLFLLGILDYAAKDEDLLKAIHEERGIPPAAIMTAVERLAPAPEAKASEPKTEAAALPPRRALFR